MQTRYRNRPFSGRPSGRPSLGTFLYIYIYIHTVRPDRFARRPNCNASFNETKTEEYAVNIIIFIYFFFFCQ